MSIKLPNLILFVLFLFPSAVKADFNFEAADQLFHERQISVSKIKEALNAYNEALNSRLDDHEKVYSTEQSARLLMYYNYTTSESNIRLRTQIANTCLDKIKTISPKKLGSETPHYYYWKSVCLMARAEAQSSLNDSNEIARLIKKGSTVDSTYEGGGFDRLNGIFYAKLPAFNPFGPSRNLSKSIIHFKRTIDADFYNDPNPADWKDPSTETGEYFFSTYFYYAEALIKKRRRDEASEIIQDALDRIENGDVAEYRSAENAVAKERLQNLLRFLN